MKVRVKHFCGEYFTVEYSLRWWQSWETWGYADTDWPFASLVTRNHPKLFTFEDAKELADSLTPEKIVAHEEEQEEAYRLGVCKANQDNADARAKEYER